MTQSKLTKLPRWLSFIHHWYVKTPDRALEAAYQAALKIKAIETQYFEGQKISVDSNRYSQLEFKQFQKKLNNNIYIIRQRLWEFNASQSTLESIAQVVPNLIYLNSVNGSNSGFSREGDPQLSSSLERLKFIDLIVAKYKVSNNEIVSALPKTEMTISENRPQKNGKVQLVDSPPKSYKPRVNTASDIEPMSSQASVLPRSILRTIDRLKRELDPKAENDVVEEFRYHKNKTVISLKFILLLILIPLLTHQISKNFVIGPIYDRVAGEKSALFLNQNLEEEAFIDLQHFEERLKFEMLIGQAPSLSEEDLEHRVKEKAHEIAKEYHGRSDNAVKNVFADLASFGAFALVLVFSKRELSVLKSFIDDLVYGLSDSAKAFIIILFTDIFVGYHSPHGWEIILEGLSRHFGLPENREFNFLFIATFPVILDTVMKYWIFRYLNRISPSAVATYRNMNE